METTKYVERNPWWAIWIHTRGTIRSILDDPYPSMWIYAIIPFFGISITLDQISFSEYGDWYTLDKLLLISIPIGLAIGLAVWLLYGALFWGAGRLLGGKAGYKEIYLALAWATIPYLAKLVLWYLKSLTFGEETFTLYTPTIDQSFFLLSLYFVFLFIDSVLTIWFYGILIKSMAEAHQFSFWKGLASVLGSLVFLWVTLKYIFGFVWMPL